MVAQVNVPPLLIQILFVFFPENPKISKNSKLNYIETKTSDNKRWKTNEIKQADLKEEDKKKESKKKRVTIRMNRKSFFGEDLGLSSRIFLSTAENLN